MKKLTRNTIVLVIISVLVVIAIAVAGLAQVSGSALSGAAVRTITPSDPTIGVGEEIGLAADAKMGCNWFTSDSAVVSFVGDSTEVISVTVKGNALGQATITARCGLFNTNIGTTGVIVALIAPRYSIYPWHTNLNLRTANGPCAWRLDYERGWWFIEGGMLEYHLDSATNVILLSPYIGTSTVEVNCPDGSHDSLVITSCDDDSSSCRPTR